MDEPFFFTNSRGLRLSGILSRPVRQQKAPVVIACHGFGSGKDRETNRQLAARLHQLGIASLRFDFTGHNDSEGDIAQVTVSQGVDDLRAAIQSLSRYPLMDGLTIGLFGHSYGGAVALWYAADYDDVTGIALQAPVSDYAAVKERKLGPEGIMEWRTTGYTLEDTDAGMVRLNYEFYEDAQSRDTYDLARRINRDCLILHGERDDTVPLEQSRALAEALGPRAELHIIPNATHAFSGPSELQKVMRKTEGFFRDRLRTRV